MIQSKGESWRLKKGAEKGESTRETVLLWFKIYDEWIETFGLPKNFKQKIKIQKRLINLYADFLGSGDRRILNDIAIEEQDLEDLIKDNSPIDFFELEFQIEDALKIRIGKEPLSTYEFYKYTRGIDSKIKRLKQNARTN